MALAAFTVLVFKALAAFAALLFKVLAAFTALTTKGRVQGLGGASRWQDVVGRESLAYSSLPSNRLVQDERKPHAGFAQSEGPRRQWPF